MAPPRRCGAAWPLRAMIVALSRFTIANDMVEEMRSAFGRRPHLVDSAPGFLGMEIMSPVDRAAEMWLVTRWSDEQSYRAWHRGHEYHEAHKGIPRGLKLVPGSASVTLLEVFAE
jgi:heme-degrading monooxygenase HmoA